MRIKFEYKNHRGQIEERDVDIVAVNFDFTVHPEYGYQPGWCFAGWDYSRGREGKEYRTFYHHNIILHDSTAKGTYRPVFTLFELPREGEPSFWHNGAGQMISRQDKINGMKPEGDPVWASRFDKPLYEIPEGQIEPKTTSFAERLKVAEAAGVVSRGKAPEMVECSVCHGSGIEQILGRDNNVLEPPCSACDGRGTVEAA